MAFLKKLTDEQVAEIIERRSTGESYHKIAEDYGISGSRVYELTHPEIQAAKAAKIKARNAQKRAEKKAAEAASNGGNEDFSDLDLSDVDSDVDSEADSEADSENAEAEVELM